MTTNTSTLKTLINPYPCFNRLRPIYLLDETVNFPERFTKHRSIFNMKTHIPVLVIQYLSRTLGKFKTSTVNKRMPYCDWLAEQVVSLTTSSQAKEFKMQKKKYFAQKEK